jgi:hypothetical protein
MQELIAIGLTLISALVIIKVMRKRSRKDFSKNPISSKRYTQVIEIFFFYKLI